ncbi:MAG: hypothetical protein M5U22_02300 [Thermoleophilia bacterium]|nr:hypothetical protein [Thermoleophilia bacterium]
MEPLGTRAICYRVLRHGAREARAHGGAEGERIGAAGDHAMGR